MKPIMSTHGRLRADQRPLYMQASDAYRALLRSGNYRPGDRLPSEIELSQQWGISRPTLREALRLLEEEGVIVRRHGVGTFAAPPRPVLEAGLEVLESIERVAERRGLTTQMEDLAVSERAASDLEAVALGLTLPALVTVITRAIAASGQRVAYLTDVVPQAYLRRGDLGPDFSGSVLDLFLERGSPTLAHSWTELAAEAAGPDLARRLRVSAGAPLLKLMAQLHATDGRVVDYSTSYFLPGYFRFHVVRRIG
jgi:GntR family transcriptional regulator